MQLPIKKIGEWIYVDVNIAALPVDMVVYENESLFKENELKEDDIVLIYEVANTDLKDVIAAEYIIFTRLLACDGCDGNLAAKCYRACLNEAKKKNLHSIAFPPPFLSEARSLAIISINSWLAENKDYEIKIFMAPFVAGGDNDGRKSRNFKKYLKDKEEFLKIVNEIEEARKKAKNFKNRFENDEDFYTALKQMGIKWRRGCEMEALENAILSGNLNKGVKKLNVNKQKSEAYKKLVNLMKETYPKFDYSFDPLDSRLSDKFWAPYVKINNKMTCICEEINLWTYWQGLGYAEKVPKIKYLLVGQDYGGIFPSDNNTNNKKISKIKSGIIEHNKRISEINAGNKSLSYFDTTENPTNRNLMELFKVLGYNDIITRHDDLFFTNFCLAYKTGSGTGSVPNEIMEKSAPLFKDLCNILEPENILCLGQQVFECVYETLTEKKASTLTFYNRSYNTFIENHADIKVNCGNVETRIYPLAHCGTYGTMNRNYVKTVINKYGKKKKIYEPDTKDLGKQKQDWTRIAQDNGI